MGKKINILVLSIWYPLSISRYFLNALHRNKDLSVISTGPFTGSWIPWLGGMNVENKYAVSPDIPLPFKPDIGKVPYDFVKSKFPADWKPDLILTIDAGINWSDKPSEDNSIVATVATDSHCLSYSHARNISDYFFNMHPFYIPYYLDENIKDIPLPYAFDPGIMYPMDIEKEYDAVLVGMPYPQRVQWVNELEKNNVSVIFKNGPIFDEYRELNNKASIGLNWASEKDLNCRVFELMAMKLCPVINYVPDLERLGFTDRVHYIGFSNLSEAVDGVLFAKNNPDTALEIANAAYNKVYYENHTFDSRINTILEKCGLL